MRTGKSWIAGGLLIATISESDAEDRRVATTYGGGVDSCGRFLEAFDVDPSPGGVEIEGREYVSRSAAYREWLLGFVTAFNMSNGQRSNVEVPDTSAITGWARRWCQEHPADRLSSAAWHFVVEQGAFDTSQM